MTWPPQSPDLNPIEMVSDELDHRVKEKQPTSAQHMWELLQDCRKHISAPLAKRCYSHGGKQETDEEFDARWVNYFNKADIDAWELRKGMNTLIGYDLVPEPKILDAALRACRGLDDLASAIRILEAVKDKSGPHKDIYPYLIQELRPTLDELGISTPEELGMDKL
ncbi:cytochrome c oxidase subunit 5A, mitochondrial-like isoform X1 [Oncorhynchus nerka]|uniref:cytochrome c oxidase subunit 5A, mitochondrial-like isoform X1 n=1 Tax=Oncorhynchus nerka TaxID=8023 RepID=UPI0031B8A56F